MPHKNEAIVSVVFGRRGSGKSVKVRNLTKGCKRILYFDTMGMDYTNGVVIEDIATLQAFLKRQQTTNFKVVYRPENPVEDFPKVCFLVYNLGYLTFVVEELDTFYKVGRCCSDFSSICFKGRKFQIEVIGVTQRPAGIKNITSQAKEFFIFSTREPVDLKYFKEYMGQECLILLEQINPQDYQYVHWIDTGQMEIKKDEYTD